MTTRFHHINLCAKDPSDLENFYKDVLELSESNAYSGNQKQIENQGYGGRVAFLTDGASEMHLSTLDLNVAFRTKQPINPLERGHIAFRTDDIEAFKAMLREKNIQFADYGVWAIGGWYQIFLQDPDGTIVEVHQTDYKAPAA